MSNDKKKITNTCYYNQFNGSAARVDFFAARSQKKNYHCKEPQSWLWIKHRRRRRQIYTYKYVQEIYAYVYYAKRYIYMYIYKWIKWFFFLFERIILQWKIIRLVNVLCCVLYVCVCVCSFFCYFFLFITNAWMNQMNEFIIHTHTHIHTRASSMRASARRVRCARLRAFAREQQRGKNQFSL